jgi:hypothetical protein
MMSRSVCELAYMTIRRVVVIGGNDLSRVCPRDGLGNVGSVMGSVRNKKR